MSKIWLLVRLFLFLNTLGDHGPVRAQSAQVVIDAYPNTTTVEQGSTLILVCRVVGVPSTTVLSYQWACPGGYCDAGAVDPEWAARIQQGNILVVNVRNSSDNGDYTCTVMANTQQLGTDTYTLSVANGLSLLNEDGGLRAFFPKNSFVINTTLTHTNSPRMYPGSTSLGDDHIVCYGGNLQAGLDQVPWYNNGGTRQLVPCTSPCTDCGGRCQGNGGVGVDPALNGQTDIHVYTNVASYVSQDLECRVSGGKSTFIGVYLKNGVSTALQPPTTITPGATTPTSVSVSWSQVSNATGYYMSYQRQDLGAPPVVTPQYERIVGGDNTSVTLSGLEPGTTYRIRVWSTDGASVSSGLGEMDVATMESAPSPPRMLTIAGNATISSVELNWLPPLHPNGAIHYEIEYEPAMTPGDPVNAGSSSSPYFTLTLPIEFLTFNVTVTAVNTQGIGSEQSSVLPVCLGESREEGPDPPTGVMVEANGCSSALVAWTPTQSRMCDVRIEGYSVRYRLSNSTGGYTTVNSSSTSVTLQDLVPNAEYTMDVAAIYSNGEMSTYSAETSLTITALEPPIGVSVEDGAGCYTSVVSWVAPQPMCTDVMENYSVRYQLRNSSGNYTTVQSSTTSVTLQGLTANAEYIVSVAAITSAGGMSSFTEATQFELLEPKPPTGVTFTVTGSDSAVVSWMASQSMCDNVIGNYSVRYRPTSVCSYTTVYTDETSVVLQGIEPNAEYTVSVAAINSNGDMSAYSVFTPTAPAVATTQDGCAAAAAGATIGGFTGGVLLSAAIAGVIAAVVLYRGKRRHTATFDTTNPLFEDQKLELHVNPAYGRGIASTAGLEKEEEDYVVCNI